MIKSMSMCAVSLMLGAPALAEERSHENGIIPPRSGMQLAAKSMQSVQPSTARPSDRFTLPVLSKNSRWSPITPSLTTPVPRRADQHFSLVYHVQEGESGTSLRLTEITSDDGGRYAVHEALSDQRKPRFRRSAFGTMLTLRLDGEAESPPFSVGGGGVAALVWQAVPKRY